jgi:hypothetical protein
MSHDNFNYIVFDFKIVPRQDKLGPKALDKLRAKTLDKNWNSYPH